MFLWAREVQLLPEAPEVHEVLGNQEHQRYQELPTERETGGTGRKEVCQMIGHVTIHRTGCTFRPQ